MNTQSSPPPAQKELSDSDLNVVVGGHGSSQYVEMNGNTYVVSHIHGQTLMVKVA